MILILVLISALFLIWLIGYLNAGAIWGGPQFDWIDGWTRILCKTLHGLGNQTIALPEQGGAIVVANHVSGLDPLLLIAASKRPLRFLIAREEYERPGLHWIFKNAGCIPVDRHGRPEKALRQALRALQQGEVIALFPHGKIHLDSEPAKKIKGGVARLAAWTGLPVIPVRIDGVTGLGKILTAPLLPSRVQLTVGSSIYCEPESLTQCLEQISQAIEPQSSESS